ncbi:MAG: aldehyde dehydrogenase family protein [Melioribacteraceae bacterium]|nr:aldehyde dehydrogenase family protein [Melioribacteraceae bacterium]
MERAKENETICYNPATGEEIGRSKIHSVDELRNIIDRAKTAQIEWGAYPVKKRIAIVKKVREYIVNNADEMSETISKDNGKTRVEALATEVLPASMAISFYCSNAKKFLAEKLLRGGNFFLINKRSKIIRIPYGVVGIISPWNYPFAIPFSEVIMGLLAGNAIVLKTATETQLVGLQLKKAIEYANLPEGLFSFVNLPGKVAGDEMLRLGINKLFFTGSVAVGKYLMGKASATLTPVCLELGGNDAMIVCEDADPYRAAMGALWAGFQNSGQSCGGVERIYVHENIYDQFMAILKDKIDNLNVNYGSDYNSQMGCMTTTRQVDTVNLHIEDALKKGATIYAQSQIVNSTIKNFIPATVLTNVNHDMLVMKDETFGPVVGVMKFKNIEDAITLANDSYLGLTGSVWSRNQKYAEGVAKKIKAGVVTVNDHLMSHGLAETPWGGFKESGIGRTHGKFGFDEMTQPMVIVKDLLSFTKKQLWWHPYSIKIYDGLKGLINLLYNKSLLLRIKSVGKLIKILPRMFYKE